MADPSFHKWMLAFCIICAGLPEVMAVLFLVTSTSRTYTTKLFIFNKQPFSVVATVSGLNNDSSGLLPGNSRDLAIIAKSYSSIELPASMSMNATGIYDEHALAIHSNSDIDILMQSQTSSLGNLIRVPHVLQYSVLCFPVTPGCINYNVIHIVSRYTTEVYITFPVNKPNTKFLSLYGKMYYGGDTLFLELQSYATALVESVEDLTGTIITANEDIGMFSGCDSDAAHSNQDYRSNWVLGKNDMGLQFVVMAHEEPSFSYEKYVIVAASENTTVVIYSGDDCFEEVLEHSGDSRIIGLNNANEVVLANKLISVVHLPFNMAGLHNMYYVIPVSLFHSAYMAPSFNGLTLNVKMVFHNDSYNRFGVDSQPVTVDVRDSHLDDFIAVGKLSGVFSLNNIHFIQDMDGYLFGGYIWYTDTNDRLFITTLGRKAIRSFKTCGTNETQLYRGCVDLFEHCEAVSGAATPSHLTPQSTYTHHHPSTTTSSTANITATTDIDVSGSGDGGLESTTNSPPLSSNPPTTTTQSSSSSSTKPKTPTILSVVSTDTTATTTPTAKQTTTTTSTAKQTTTTTSTAAQTITITSTATQTTTTTTGGTTVHSGCPTNAAIYNNNGNVICYWAMSTTYTTYKQSIAADFCAQSGGQLPIIPNSVANDVVVNLIASRVEHFFLNYKTKDDMSGKLKTSLGDIQEWTNGLNTTHDSHKCIAVSSTGSWSITDCSISVDNGILCSMCEVGGTSCYTNSSCGTCSCSYIINSVNMTKELQASLDKLKQTTAVNKKALSSSLRRMTCADDPRPSSAAMGYLGASLLTIIFGGLIIMDMPFLILEFKAHVLGKRHG
ncbi:uncharacterized protein [Argopecten irradians]|uniref:uncharacterized protein n=1 Tax=Argopecten irradians TaxID=31199 RepID=UPI003720F644